MDTPKTENIPLDSSRKNKEEEEMQAAKNIRNVIKQSIMGDEYNSCK